MSPTTTPQAESSSLEGAKPEEQIILTGTVDEWLQVQDSLPYTEIGELIWRTIEDQTSDFPAEAIVDVVFTRVSRESLYEMIRVAGITIESTESSGVDGQIKVE